MFVLNKIKYYIVIGTVVLTALILYAVISIYSITLETTKEHHQTQQIEMSKAAIIGLKTYLTHIRRDMEQIAKYANTMRKNSSDLLDLISHYDRDINGIIVRNHNEIILQTGGELPFRLRDSVPHNHPHPESNHLSTWMSDVYSSSDRNNDTSLFVAMAVSDLNHTSAETHPSDVIFVIDIYKLLQKFIAPLKLGKADYAWVLDGKGRLIYHPGHEEMLLRSIGNPPEDCRVCHLNFDPQIKMLQAKEYATEYYITNDDSRITSSTQFEFGSLKWIVAISTVLPEITGSIRDQFRLFFMLGIVILFIIFTLGSMLYFVNSKRIKAEEATKTAMQMHLYQEQLNHATKLASIGELVDSVAHEINTPLGIISAHADALLLSNRNDTSIREGLDIIKNQTKRITKFTRSLLGYSAPIESNPRMENVQGIINEALFLLQHKITEKGITVSKEYQPEIPYIYLDKDQLLQVIFNMLNNAIDAVPDLNGIINISISRVNESATEQDLSNGCIRLSITDNGRGIPEENLEKIFKPFFTTKEYGKGTGLGLAISKAIVTKLNGKMEVESKTNRYTKFSIVLPANHEGYC